MFKAIPYAAINAIVSAVEERLCRAKLHKKSPWTETSHLFTLQRGCERTGCKHREYLHEDRTFFKVQPKGR
jgi:hypothetical protein